MALNTSGSRVEWLGYCQCLMWVQCGVTWFCIVSASCGCSVVWLDFVLSVPHVGAVWCDLILYCRCLMWVPHVGAVWSDLILYCRCLMWVQCGVTWFCIVGASCGCSVVWLDFVLSVPHVGASCGCSVVWLDFVLSVPHVGDHSSISIQVTVLRLETRIVEVIEIQRWKGLRDSCQSFSDYGALKEIIFRLDHTNAHIYIARPEKFDASHSW